MMMMWGCPDGLEERLAVHFNVHISVHSGQWIVDNGYGWIWHM